jgi:hypothetical protein
MIRLTRKAWYLVLATAVAVTLALIVGRFVTAHQPATALVNPSCGRVVNDALFSDARPTECLWKAYLAGTAAQAIIVQFTAEGDPITYAVNISSPTHVDIDIDSKDRYGPRGRFGYSCIDLTRHPTVRVFLIATGCTGPQSFLDGSNLTIP